MAMLLRRSAVRGILRNSGAPLPRSSRQADVQASLRAPFFASSSAPVAGSGIRGSQIRGILQGHRHYGTPHHEPELTKDQKLSFLGTLKALKNFLAERYWKPRTDEDKALLMVALPMFFLIIEQTWEVECVRRRAVAMLNADKNE